IIQTLYSGYELKNVTITVNGSDEVNVSPIQLAASSVTLKEALVVAKKIPMVFKGDTIVYNPSAFNTKTSATVEDLLKKLPGVQVGKDGAVTAQGEKVVKVMVNGKEFFGNDPTKATQNINADAIEKVEILDKKSDGTEFTGVDDGTREKVINLVLKENANEGYFGKVEVGGGTEETYRAKAVINRFKNENQYTFIGNANNLNQNGFSWREYYNMLNGAGGVNLGQTTYWYSENQWLGENQEGRQQNAVIGANAHMKIGKKGELDASYFMMDRSNNLQTSSISENYLPAYTILGNSSGNSDKANGQHKGIGHYEWKPDTLNFLSVNAEADYTFGDGTDFSSQRNQTVEGTLLSSALSNTLGWRTNLNLKAGATYYRTFKKNENSLMFMTAAEHNEGRDTTRWATNLAYTEIDPEMSMPFQRMDNIYGTGDAIYNRMSFNYEIKKYWYAQLGVENKISQDVYTQVRNNLESDEVIADQSPDITTNTSISKADIGISKNRKNPMKGWYMNFQFNTSLVDLSRQVDLASYSDNAYNSQKLFVWPSGYLSYHKPKKMRIGFWFNGSTNLPTITQVNPVKNVTNPVRISSGNFKLDPTLGYNAGSHFNTRNPGKNSFWYGHFNTGFTPNDFIRAETRDDKNVSNITWTNGGKSTYLNSNLHYQFEIKKLHLELGNSVSYNYFSYLSVLNNAEYLNQRHTFGYEFDIEFQLDDFAIDFQYEPQYTIQNSELLASNISFWRHNFSSELNWDITDRIEFSADYNVYYFNTQQVGSQQLVPIVNSSLECRLDSNQRWIIGINAYDMLKKAQSINRNFFNNTYSEIRQNTLTRYFMFNVSYSIKKGQKEEERHRRWD
ncbi:MAG: outer membrane beta-barrel protein, partial [Bacteroidetes bacterium]|nr:outer membrane beta-barrel protein [Bacteroidota bacterium]